MSWNDPHTYRVNELAGIDVDMDVDIGGNLIWLHDGKPGCRIRHNASQNILNDSPTQLSLNTVDFNVGDMAISSAIEIQEDATWLVGGCVHFNSTLNGRREMWIELVGAGAKLRHLVPATSTTNLDTVIGGSVQVPLEAGDILRLFAYQDSGGTISSQASGAAFPALFAVWIGGE